MNGFIFGFLALVLTYLGGSETKQKPFFRIILVLLLAYVVGMGGLSFTDHSNYANFYNMQSGSIKDIRFALIGISQVETGFESGYVFLNYFAHLLGLGEAGFFFLMAFITNYLLVDVVYRFKYPVFSMILVLVSISFIQQANLVRQMLAVSIFLYGLKFLNRENIKFYVLCVILATLNHTSSIVMLALIPLAYLNKQSSILLCSIGVGWLLSILVFANLIHPDYLHILDFFTYYEVKVKNTDQLTDNVIIITYNVYALLCFISLIKNKHYTINGYMFLLFLGAILLNMSSQFYFFYRLSFFAIPVSSFLIPTIINSITPVIWKYSVLFYAALLFYISVLCRDVLFNADYLYFKEMYSLTDLFR